MNHLPGRTAPLSLSLPQTSIWKRWYRALCQIQQNARTRRVLAGLNDQQLADVGISHSDRLAELDKPFWR
ncbi:MULTISPECIES: DUF1127 domain-containing protein [Pseudomonas]|uniref:DUF1127 domain-containing protein n=1 Tax=Pseudomonas TaxID=286 RepID=UPI0005BEEED7|nr:MULTISPECIES: DUF1127 domain-containing protein [Pseudomonas]AJO75850.1 hypothetical protein TO66_00550 [Pseudomonas sp. MRSN 12121]MCB2253616.1 DUF1127 domain-containing protein [Pseudomonas chlororaphis]